MDLTFATLPGALDGALPPAPQPQQDKPAPQVPPPCWDDRVISPEACEAATHAMCG